MVDADRAELVDDDRAVRVLWSSEDAIEQRGFAAAEKAGK